MAPQKKTGGRQKGTPNKRKGVAKLLLEDIEYKLGSNRKKKGFDPLEFQVMLICEAWDMMQNATPDDSYKYMEIARKANEKLLDKVHASPPTPDAMMEDSDDIEVEITINVATKPK